MSAKPNFKKSGSQFFHTIEELYKQRIGSLVAFASRHVYRRDLAIDVVHDALAKSVVYFNKYPDKKVSERIIQFLILKACKKVNKFSKEEPRGDTRLLME